MDLKEIQDIVNNVLYKRALTRTELITYGANALAMNATKHGTVVPYKRWRMVAVGFTVTQASIAAENPEVEFGIAVSDIGAADADYFGSATVFSEGGAALLTVGDVYIKDDAGYLGTPDALAAAGDGVAITWHAGAGHLMVWQTKAGLLTVTRPNDHQLAIIPFMLVEVQD